MNRWILALVLSLFVAFQASAQEIQVSGGLDEVNVYVADGGDTLWDIADRFFQDPWYWPVLWSFNPHITNPNWIFPGDHIFLIPPKPQTPVRDGYAVTESRYSAGPQMERALGRRVGFISEESLKGAGRIQHSREEKKMLSETDEAYIRFDTVRRIREGDLFLVFRVEGKKIKHPVTKKKLGYKIRYLGVTKVTSTETELNKAVLLISFEEIFRGDRVAPFAPVQRSVPPVRNASDLEATVVTTFDDIHYLGEYHYAIIDKGSDDGVMAGNRFLVREQGDGVDEYNPKPKKRKDFPMETRGEIIVIETYEKTSLGLVTYANREVEVGAFCEMLAGY
ncbi:MAG TPA: LysM peptidoglycan-binding domain-containing protein [Myxococcota bacterium]|jgi:hypothetical protein|nr:LysM peptidoglycan-binding domain-containing protein [Myxococcota bacterium]OQC41118.1 MAG: LysM domain protein [Deltaproteobacteria bacterium ADurb.Bin058]HHW96496.1 LysM peptidoglycan-binding domain-containing protein [Oligoflexales bacterium]MBP8970056.1 LysM peptidoglycan-binding domain-containing protein [Myxococcota bacterium]HQC45518.1 LysM peptidoglycan-binding domain-containing protein [Myxococcota bacterium]